MHRPLEGQRLEVRPTVVDVHDRSEVSAVQQRHQVLVLRYEDYAQGGVSLQGVVGVDLADDHERSHTGVLFEDR